MAFRDIWAFFGQIDPVTHRFVPKSWTVESDPGVNAKATATKAAATGKRHIATNITVMFTAGASAPTAVVVTAALIDGSSGGTTYLWGPHRFALPAVAGAMNGVAIPIWCAGSTNTDMTLEFSAAGGANTYESITLNGVTI